MAEAKNVDHALARANDLLRAARYGVTILRDAPGPDKIVGVFNVAVFGRSVTFALQNLRTVVGDDFDNWYRDVQAEMQSSDLCRYMLELRNEILKEGTPQTRITQHMGTLTMTTSGEVVSYEPPEGGVPSLSAKSDGEGGVIVALIPSAEAPRAYEIGEPPTTHLGLDISGESFESLAAIYCDYLEQILERATAHFSDPS